MCFIGCNNPNVSTKSNSMVRIKDFNSTSEYLGTYKVDSISKSRLKNINGDITLKIIDEKYIKSNNLPSSLLKYYYDSEDSITFNTIGEYSINNNDQEYGKEIYIRFDKNKLNKIRDIEMIDMTGSFYRFKNKICFVIFIGDPDSGNSLKFIKEVEAKD
ncbi:MAG: hypothetical protein RLZZ175_2124 [Bacteroidota bacterium]|jgi:hypothetical protein